MTSGNTTEHKTQTCSIKYELVSSGKPCRRSAYVSWGTISLMHHFATRKHAGVPPVPVTELGRLSQVALDAAQCEDPPPYPDQGPSHLLEINTVSNNLEE